MLGSPVTLCRPGYATDQPRLLPQRSSQCDSPNRETVLEGTSDTRTRFPHRRYRSRVVHRGATSSSHAPHAEPPPDITLLGRSVIAAACPGRVAAIARRLSAGASGGWRRSKGPSRGRSRVRAHREVLRACPRGRAAAVGRRCPPPTRSRHAPHLPGQATAFLHKLPTNAP